MSSLKIGYLFKKKYITHQNKKYEVFEFIDYVSGIGFTNTQHNDICNILSGNNAGVYASFINEDANEKQKLSDLLFENILKNIVPIRKNRHYERNNQNKNKHHLNKRKSI